MRRFSLRQPGTLLSRSAARNAALLNQFATPGLGSLLAGRRLAGLGQLVLAVAGFLMIMLWFILLMVQTYQQLVNSAPAESVAKLGIEGAILFALAWCWSLVTSLSLLREARASEPPTIPTARP